MLLQRLGNIGKIDGIRFPKRFPRFETMAVSYGKSGENDGIINNNNNNDVENALKSKFGEASFSRSTLPQYVWKNVHRWENFTMATCGISGRKYSYGFSKLACKLFARALIKNCYVRKGDVMALLLPNVPEYVISIYGALEAGMIVTFVNPLYTPDEIRKQFEDAGVTTCITISQFVRNLEEATKGCTRYKNTIMVQDRAVSSDKYHDFQSLLMSQTNDNDEIALPSMNEDDVAALPYSSGTTGLPKGVMLTHKNLVVNLEQLYPELVDHLPTNENSQEVILSILPFFHIYGFNSILNLALCEGSHIVTIPKFTPESYLECLQKYKPSMLFVVPSLLMFLESHPLVKSQHLESVREIICGAAPASKNLLGKFVAKFGNKLRVRQGYGMTELSPCALFTPVEAPHRKFGSAGVLIKSTQARVISLENGGNLPVGHRGELLIKGPQVMKGYWNNEKATADMIDHEGWLHTGDVAFYDADGYFYIVDRTKELIKVKGYQVSPTELESLIIKMEGVCDVAVVGVEDEDGGEKPRAFVVVKSDSRLTENQVMEFVSSKMAPYKKLTGGVAFVSAIPRNTAGKILRVHLKRSSKK